MQRRFAREHHEYRAYGYDLVDGRVSNQEKGPWRVRKVTARADAQEIDRLVVVVQKVRIGITKVLETERIK